MSVSEKEVEKALEDIFHRKSQRPAPPGAKMQLVTEDAGTFDAGYIFEAQTVKGGTNYVVFAMAYNGWAYYFHGDRAKKVSESRFKSLISHGDLVPVPREKADPERLALCVLGLNAMLNGLAFNDYMQVIFGHGPGSQIPVSQ